MPPPSDSRRVRAARQLFGHLAREDPHFHADGAVGRLGRRRRVVDVGAERVQRHPPLVVALGARDLGAAQATRRLDLDPLRPHPHRALHRALHGAPKRDALRQLMRHGVRHELRVQLRPLDLLDVDAHFLAGQLGQLVAEVDKLRDELAQLTGKEVGINVEEIKRPELDAQLVADSVAHQLTQRISFRRAMKRAVQSAMRMGAQGIKIKTAGRLGGAEIARTEGYHEGRVPLHTLRADVDYAISTAKTTYGTIGVKVWIFKGERTEDLHGRTYSTGV